MIDAFYAFFKKLGIDEPLHSPITHLPIGLTVGAFVFILLVVVFRRKNLLASSRHAAILAFIFAFPTIILGVLDWLHFYHGALMPVIIAKMILATVVLLSLGAAIIVGSEEKPRKGWLTVLYGIAFVSVFGLGFLGSSLVRGKPVDLSALFPSKPAAVAPSVSAPSATSAPAATNAPAADAAFARGQAIFAANCQACHGDGGNVIVASLPLKTSTKLASLDRFSAFVRSPAMPDGSAGQMPPFSSSLVSQAQLADLYAYVTKAWK